VATRTFNVNVRTPQFGDGAKVRLKERELTTEFVNWDDKLTLEFNGPRPVVRTIELTPLTEAVTVYLLGDSTVCDQPKEPWNSWGQMLPRFLGPGVVVANHAESGESLRSSLGARRLDKVLSTLRPGDYLFLQYGHNDMKEKGEGVGAFTTYQADLRRFVVAARAAGGIPVLVTSMHRKSLDAAGKIQNTLGDYPAAVRALAAAEQGRFWEWCGVLARDEGVPGAERMAELARGLGMDPAKIAQSMAEHRHRGRIEADTAEALERGVLGGTVVMNGTVFRGEPTLENLARHMDEHACCGKAADFQRPRGLPGR
jgi:lysophospholipase L1-like esterase